jgi:hypothetical protein
MWGVTGRHVASIQPGPTFDHGTSSIVASTPCAAAGVAGAGADVAADVAGLLDDSCAAGELVVDEHPAATIAAIAKTPTPLSNLWFMLMSFSVERVGGCCHS